MKVPPLKVPRLVVRADSPRRRRILIIASLLGIGLLVWGAFEWGRGNLGLPGGITPDRVALRDRVAALEGEIRTLRVELAKRETERVGQARERTELARTIGALQADKARLESELGFYHGVVGNSAQTEVLKIQQFRVTRGSGPGEYRVRLVLGRPLRLEEAVSGKVRMVFEGAPGSTPDSLDLATAGGVESGELTFTYRYVGELEQQIRLPAGFTPARTVVEIVPGRKGVNPVRETFLWTVDN